MEESKIENNGNKRSRVDSGLDSVCDSPESKRVNTVSHGSSELDRVGSKSGSPNSTDPDVIEADVDLDSPEAKQIREDILDILDEPDGLTDCPPEIQDLDSVIKSFEEEIFHPSGLTDPQAALDLTSSDSGESKPDLGYLLEASDDELGLPPSNDVIKAKSNGLPDAASDIGNIIGFEHDLHNYDTFDFGMVAGATEEGSNVGDSNSDFVTVGGLFEYPEPSDFSEFSWRPESLPAL